MDDSAVLASIDRHLARSEAAFDRSTAAFDRFSDVVERTQAPPEWN